MEISSFFCGLLPRVCPVLPVIWAVPLVFAAVAAVLGALLLIPRFVNNLCVLVDFWASRAMKLLRWHTIAFLNVATLSFESVVQYRERYYLFCKEKMIP